MTNAPIPAPTWPVAERRGGIYAITVTVNGAERSRYVGSTNNMRRRKSRHFTDLRCGRHDNSHMQRAWNRYGAATFAFVPLAVLEPSDLIETERRLLAQHFGTPGCLNLASDPRLNLLGRKQSPEHVAKRAAANRGQKRSAEICAQMSAERTGRMDSDETRARKRAAKAGWVPVKATEAARLANTGRTFSAERCANIAAALRGKAAKPAGWKHTPETLAKMRAGRERRRQASAVLA